MKQPINRIEEQNKVDAFLRIIEEGIPANLLILGSTGVGKTTIVKYCLDKRVSTMEAKQVYLHLHHVFSKKAIFDMIVDSLRPRQKTGTIQDSIRVIIEEANRLPLLIVLDEIEPKLLDYTLNTLARLNQDSRQGYISVIVICNDITVEFRLGFQTQSAAQLHKIFFSPYQNPVLFQILQEDVKKRDIKINKSVLLRIASVAADKGGDARIALRLLESYRLLNNDIESLIVEYITDGFASQISLLKRPQKVFLYCLAHSTIEKGRVSIRDLYTNFRGDISRKVDYCCAYKQFYRIACGLNNLSLVYLDRGKKGKGMRSKVYLSDALENRLGELEEILERDLEIKESTQREVQKETEGILSVPKKK